MNGKVRRIDGLLLGQGNIHDDEAPPRILGELLAAEWRGVKYKSRRPPCQLQWIVGFVFLVPSQRPLATIHFLTLNVLGFVFLGLGAYGDGRVLQQPTRL